MDSCIASYLFIIQLTFLIITREFSSFVIMERKRKMTQIVYERNPLKKTKVSVFNYLTSLLKCAHFQLNSFLWFVHETSAMPFICMRMLSGVVSVTTILWKKEHNERREKLIFEISFESFFGALFYDVLESIWNGQWET